MTPVPLPHSQGALLHRPEEAPGPGSKPHPQPLPGARGRDQDRSLVTGQHTLTHTHCVFLLLIECLNTYSTSKVRPVCVSVCACAFPGTQFQLICGGKLRENKVTGTAPCSVPPTL